MCLEFHSLRALMPLKNYEHFSEVPYPTIGTRTRDDCGKLHCCQTTALRNKAKNPGLTSRRLYGSHFGEVSPVSPSTSGTQRMCG